ncbi:undecaprenyldiphospho-muramoylpentapeptide beta-N-acetylglucosaminyltransferase [Tenacibaculum finnmarkense]|uniref:UDP-N-acetylglucosamine--N-acetylmuramyl-(pentapeptide) pyrophosphoryl-undecaprenol N-acetylglucosamine transferase n=1 Tax=Tenacibaculum finnmarkense genomovar finnmarkense TaxID=1458503 RepID=A0AAP1RGZ3_9FLAO|nr:undecaprenyldiphospho-muramoylpentapeptide beta-N-acetylglucosaminyltransferase [Tenacibaculum finnmarkense]MBE7653541.1 undecaprenyldiphospho-muramoylpentapeptide beta-N-acetylglucosaminyltransferase [Tenacibaculum finnmarkense genomovar finnmarkense]MBE7695867.1 undecaprenyldiphospho-muramoylpentapeptide beta-N-acetylglucosaminyltransferase [Tenacibaculum finnmarkense genomovar finnmarkense]MCG8731757.1 undecaprenyldiphospho-muramoylpentapeptide beta-N-acetylglucosaminyltransferase [Tenacib
MKQSINVIISGGGTGGHIYPAIAIANEIKERYPSAKILFVGASDKMEMQKVPEAGYEIKGLWISGIQRKITFKNLLFPVKLVHSLWKAKVIIKKFKPDIAIGTGGFASGPTLMVAGKKNIPTLVQEQNSYPGITNKLLSKKAHKICVAYDGLERFFSKDKIIKTGNPVRQDLLNITEKTSEGKTFFKLDKTKKTILILGGSLGARKINELIEANLDFFKAQNVQLIWQCGKLYIDDYKRYNNLENVQVYAFLNKMDLAYAAADFIISRAGASSVSELCIVGKPTVFIPSPNVAEDHQTKNAKAIVDKNGAILVVEKELTEFSKVLEILLKDTKKQADLSENMKKLALPKATKDIVNQIEKLIN